MSKKWAIVTGASGGIGLSCANILAERGYSLVLVARSKSTLEAQQKDYVSKGIGCEICVLDLSHIEAPQELVAFTDAKGIVPDVLVNNAGVGVYGKCLETNLSEQVAMLKLNVEALVSLSHLYGQKMVARKHGYILQVASTAAFQPLPYFGLYAGTKSLVLSYSRCLNFEYQDQGVSSTALCPGPTKTNFFAGKKNETTKQLASMMMSADEVARKGIDAMFARREVCVTGITNYLGAVLGRLAPSKLMMKAIADVMR